MEERHCRRERDKRSACHEEQFPYATNKFDGRESELKGFVYDLTTPEQFLESTTQSGTQVHVLHDGTSSRIGTI
jgi:hypothetical protein